MDIISTVAVNHFGDLVTPAAVVGGLTWAVRYLADKLEKAQARSNELAESFRDTVYEINEKNHSLLRDLQSEQSAKADTLRDSINDLSVKLKTQRLEID